MKSIINSLVLICCCAFLAAAAAANSNKERTREELRNKFDQIKQWVQDMRFQPDKGPVEYFHIINAALIRDFAQDAKYPGARQAASMIVELSKTSQCTDRTLELVKKVGLGTDRGVSRSDSIVSDYVNYFTNSAAKHCDQVPLLTAKFAQAEQCANKNKTVAEALRKLHPVGVDLIADDAFLIDPTNQAMRADPETWARIIEKLASSMSSKQIVANFEQVYNEALVAPCGAFVSSPVGEFTDTIDSLGYFVGYQYSIMKYKPTWSFFEKLPGEMQDNLFRLYVCQSVLLDKVNKSDVKEFIAEYGQNN